MSSGPFGLTGSESSLFNRPRSGRSIKYSQNSIHKDRNRSNNQDGFSDEESNDLKINRAEEPFHRIKRQKSDNHLKPTFNSFVSGIDSSSSDLEDLTKPNQPRSFFDNHSIPISFTSSTPSFPKSRRSANRAPAFPKSKSLSLPKSKSQTFSDSKPIEIPSSASSEEKIKPKSLHLKRDFSSLQKSKNQNKADSSLDITKPLKSKPTSVIGTPIKDPENSTSQVTPSRQEFHQEDLGIHVEHLMKPSDLKLSSYELLSIPSVPTIPKITPLFKREIRRQKEMNKEVNKEIRSAKLKKMDFTKEEWKPLAKAQRVKSDINKIFNRKKEDEEDDFLSKIKNSKFISADMLKNLTTRKNDDIDLDKELFSDLDDGHNNVSFNETRNFEKNLRLTKEKYKDKQYPGSLKEDELTEKVTNQFKYISDLLKNDKALLSSKFYSKASQMAKDSRNTLLSQSEFVRLPIAKTFSVGFYGLKRQALMAHLIQTHLEKELKDLALHNEVIRFWSVSSFVTYVLSCETAVRIAAKDLNLSTDEAYDLLLKTADYGKYITDEETIYESNEEA